MGHDIETIGRHSLDVGRLENLAKDVSERFHANVKYGYMDYLGIDQEGNEYEPDFEIRELGEVKNSEAYKNLFVLDEFYLHHQLIEKYSHAVLELPAVASSESRLNEMQEAIDGCYYEIYDFEKDDIYGTVYNDTFREKFNYYKYWPYRWGFFCRSFTEDNEDGKLLEETRNFRVKVMEFFKMLGGAEVVYLDDQGESMYMVEGFMNWDEIMHELKTKFTDTTLNIPEFMKKPALLPKGEYPLAFYDDFSDLR